MTLDTGFSDSPVSSARRQFLSTVVVATTAIAGCLGSNDGPIEVQHHSLQEGPFNTYVTGSIKNVQGSPVDVTVSVTFLDGDGAELATESATGEGIQSNESWNFDVQYEGDDVDRVSDYELETDVIETDE
ncbi:FxLYD domain-containing protein [Natribaculum luteum]|uniref:FxLYD domain-containing protein n=1 Tax=Natribaculum luteum TaxID=1586232 RepID=A0ABD5P0F7_9EURY|nr:FxLYD domain-containing protein [Natribaculum luteum]